MQALVYEQFGQSPCVRTVPDPTPASHGAVLRVMASGLCRSDWHGWMGHDDGIHLPHVPGHEMAGIVEAVGRDVRGWQPGDRVTVPFICACGHCEFCENGDQQVCPHQTQPGFTHWGSFAQFVAIDHADHNLVAIPVSLDDATAASLGCRFATAFRALVDQGQLQAGQWIAIHGCGGVGLSAIQIARALDARIIAVDIDPLRLEKARELGADLLINAAQELAVAEWIREQTRGGVHVSVDALGSPATCVQSIESLRRRGKHLQIGLLLGEQSRPAIPFPKIIAEELQILGSHGMQAHRYPAMLELVASRHIQPQKLIGQAIPLSQAGTALQEMDRFPGSGVTVITQFDR